MLDCATIRSPIDGIVIDKKIDVGDMVSPGQILVTLFDPKRMQLVASVRESLTRRLRVGQSIGVQVEGLNKVCEGKVSEIVPEAQSASRTFQVKVTGPCPAGIYTGMFGRILIPLDEEQVLVIPRRAVREVGQLELVEVVENGQLSRRAIRIGRTFGEDVEVLSGLREGEQVVLPESPNR
jgi:RND family efflux transporter MFP subunit